MRSVLLVLLLSTAVFAAPPMAKVTIHVTSAETGKPVDNASVVVKFVQGRAPLKAYSKVVKSWETRTDQQGISTIPSIPQGIIQIQVIANHFQTFGQKMEADETAKTFEIKLNPPQPQYTVK